MEGYLQKFAAKGLLKVWNTRWFKQRKGVLYYYKKKGDASPLGKITIEEIEAVRLRDMHTADTGGLVININSSVNFNIEKEKLPKNNRVFEIVTPQKTVILASENEADAKRWIELLNWHVERRKQRKQMDLEGLIRSSKHDYDLTNINALQKEGSNETISTVLVDVTDLPKGKQHNDDELQGQLEERKRKDKNYEDKQSGLIDGEKVILRESDVLLSHHLMSKGEWGALWVTNYRIIFSKVM